MMMNEFPGPVWPGNRKSRGTLVYRVASVSRLVAMKHFRKLKGWEKKKLRKKSELKLQRAAKVQRKLFLHGMGNEPDYVHD